MALKTYPDQNLSPGAPFDANVAVVANKKTRFDQEKVLITGFLRFSQEPRSVGNGIDFAKKIPR